MNPVGTKRDHVDWDAEPEFKCPTPVRHNNIQINLLLIVCNDGNAQSSKYFQASVIILHSHRDYHND